MNDQEESDLNCETGLSGTECIRHYATMLDGSPGVYRMLGEKGDVLYVGKARNLRKRVMNYTNMSNMSARIKRMVSATFSMMFLSTKTETEALLLEQNLIKQLKPRFNVLLRDDKSFPNIYISTDQEFPQIIKHRGKRIGNGQYFGPFASAAAVNRTLNQLQKVFLLRNCPDNVFSNRTRPCLQYQIKRCSAPCVGFISRYEYAKSIKAAKNFLNGRTVRVQKMLAEEMHLAVNELKFERAAAFRDRIKALTQVQSVQGINPRTVADADIIGLHMQGENACVQVFFIRGHQNWGNSAFFPRTGSGAEADEVFETFLGQFYNTKQPPPVVIASHQIVNSDLMENLLSDKLNRKVKILVPIRGEKAALVEGAVRNARETLARKLSELSTQKQLLEGVAEQFGLGKIPERIEVYDNSHIQGSNAIGAMIAVGTTGYLKSSYRKFNITNTSLSSGDDCGMMREVMQRRFNRLLAEDKYRTSGSWPDLIIVDGGEGQLTSAVKVLSELGVDGIAIIGMSKGPNRNHGMEQFHMKGCQPFSLKNNDSILYFLQRIRDEAHRFAIGTHRKKRSKSLSASELLEIPGVGATRKSALLAHFGSRKAVKMAAIEDLKAVNGISSKLADTIYSYLHDTN